MRSELPLKWIGQEEILRQLLAAWMVIDDRDIPFNPRLIGKPGVGKTTLAYAAAKKLGREVYPLPGDHGHPARGPDRHPGHRTGQPDPVRRLVPGDRHAQGRRADPRRGEPDERKGLGLPGAAPGRPALCGVHHHRPHDSRPIGTSGSWSP